MKEHRVSDFQNRRTEPEANRFGSRRGQAMLFGTLSLTVMFGVMGFATDLGWGYFTKMRMQTAADAASSAASINAYNNSDSCATVSCGVSYTCAGVHPPTNSLQSGCLYATANAPAGSTVTMIENDGAHLPANFSGSTPSMWIQATVSRSSPNYFLFWAGFQTSSVLAQSLAAVENISAGACVYALSPTAPQAVSVTGSSTLNTASCGVYIKSSSATALYVTGSSHVTATNGGKIILSCATCFSIQGSSSTSPGSPYTVATVTDPLSSLPAPTFSGCDHTNYSIGNGNSAALTHGVYCGGITIGGAATVTLGSGIYILNGGGLTVGNSGKMSGTNVMFYNTATTGQTAGPVSITGSGAANLTAPNSGPYQGIAFFQQHGLANAASISNSGTGNITGTYYFPDAPFSFTGSTQTAVTAAFVASTITISGSSSLTNDSTGKITGLAKTSIGLIQ